MKKVTLLLLATFLLSSCATMRLKTIVPYSRSNNLDTIALMPVLIGEIEQPILPLIDAGIFNAKTDKLAPEILDMEQKSLSKMATSAAMNLQTLLSTQVLYGDKLYEREVYKQLSARLHNGAALQTKDKAFPVILIHNDDFNPFAFDNAKVPEFFTVSTNFKSTVIEICKELNVDALALSYSRITITNASSFGISGGARLDTYLYVISKEGKFLINGYGLSKPVAIYGNKLYQYKDILDEFPFLFQSLLKQSIPLN